MVILLSKCNFWIWETGLLCNMLVWRFRRPPCNCVPSSFFSMCIRRTRFPVCGVHSRCVHVHDDGVEGGLQFVHEAGQAGDGVSCGGVHDEQQGGEQHKPLGLLLHLHEASLVQHQGLGAAPDGKETSTVVMLSFVFSYHFAPRGALTQG